RRARARGPERERSGERGRLQGDARRPAGPADRRRRARRRVLPRDRAGQGQNDEGDVRRRRIGEAAARLPLRRAVPARADLPHRRPRRPDRAAVAAADRRARAVRGDRRHPAAGAHRGGRTAGVMELTVESLIGELGLELISGESSAHAHVRWVHSTELADPTPWLKGGEMLLTTGLQLEGPKVQREFLQRLVDHDIAALGFGTGFRHKKVPAALVKAAQEHSFPLFEVPYELPFIAITERAFTQLLDERYELLQRTMVGDLLAEALSGHLYPEDLQARLRPFGIGERIAVLAFAVQDATAGAAMVERLLEAEHVGKLVAIRGGLVCAVVDAGEGRGGASFDAVALAGRIRVALAPRAGEVRAAASRVGPTHSLRMSFHEARCALEAVRLRNGSAPEVATYEDLGAFQLLLSLQDEE